MPTYDPESCPRLVRAMAGWVQLRDSEIAYLARYLPHGGKFLEIGSANGSSAALLADMRPDVSILCVDVFFHDGFEKGIDKHLFRSRRWLVNRRANMNLWVGTAQELTAWRPVADFDVILVDADHAYASCFRDIDTAACLLRPDGILMVHDYESYLYPGVTQAINEQLAGGCWQRVEVVSGLMVMR